MRKRINVLPLFDFWSCNSSQWCPADRNYRNWKNRKTHHLQQHNQSSVFTLPSKIAHSRQEPRRIVTKMIANSRALCLATVGPCPSDQSASCNWNPFNCADAPAYSIINEASVRSLAMCRVSELMHAFLFRARKTHFLNKSEFLKNIWEILRKSENFEKIQKKRAAYHWCPE